MDKEGQIVADLITVRDWWRWATSCMSRASLCFGQGTQNARDEAAWILLETLHLPPDDLSPWLEARLTQAERWQVVQKIRRRLQTRMPAAYLLGRAWLAGLSFRVSPDVIIPRSGLAHKISEQLVPWLDSPGQVRHALDMCSGSGCLAILIAHHFEQAHVDALDISPAALHIAGLNVKEHGLEGRIRLLEGDLFANEQLRMDYDLIVCNPPYVAHSSMQQLPPEFQYEPELALAGGEDGLDIVRQILHVAANYMSNHGLLVIEIGHHRAAVEAELGAHWPLTWMESEEGAGDILMLRQKDLQRITGA